MHVIVGAGQVGSTTATMLAERGEQVRLITRSGSGPEHQGIERVAADATDAARLSQLSEGATALYNCANPAYDRWLTDWPPLASALLQAAEHSGAVLAIVGNLYPYGPVSAPMTEATPLAATHPKLHIRAQMWWDALALQQTGRIRVTEVRGSDYLQAQGVFSFVGGPLLAGRRAYSPAPLDVPHSWTSTTDVATMLITAAQDQRAWGKAWHVPTTEPLTLRQLASRFTDVVGAPAAKLTAIPWPVMWTYGMFTPFVKELRTTRYQFVKPFILDSSAATRTFGLKPQSLDEALLETARLLRK